MTSPNLDSIPFATDLIFIVCAGVILAASIAVVTLRNPVRATLMLILSFLPTSLLYVMLHASFVGVLQILVYAGAIMMLFTFVIMMINPAPKGGETPEDGPQAVGGRNPPSLTVTLGTLGLLIAIAALFLPVLRQAAAGVGPGQPLKEGFGGLQSIGALLFTHPGENPLTISFELISFLILVGIIAALNFSRRKQNSSPNEP